jgi:outer membrane usher protein FimD/PapC
MKLAFGEAQNTSEVSLSVFVNGTFQTTFPVKDITDHSFILTDKEPLKNLVTKFYLDSFANNFIVENIEKEVDFEIIKKLPNQVDYNYNELKIMITINAELLKAQKLDVESDSYSITPNSFSFYVNSFINQSLYPNVSSNLSLDGAINLWGLVFEGAASKNSLSPNWTLYDFFFTRDFAKARTRMHFGDLTSSGIGFQGSVHYLGVRADRVFGMDPNKNIVPLEEYSFFLKQESFVEIFVNGRIIFSKILRMGKHSFENIILNHGFNSITIKTRKLGTNEVEEIKYNEFGNRNLLERGLNQFSYSLGYLNKGRNEFYKYTPGDPLSLNFYHKVGVTKIWTTGAYSNISNNFYLAGNQNIIRTDVGNIIADFATNGFKNETKKGYALNLGWEYLLNTENTSPFRRVDLNFNAYTPKFSNDVGNYTIDAPKKYDAVIGTGFTFTDIVTINGSLYGTDFLYTDDLYGIRFNISKTIARKYRFNMTVANDFVSNAKDNFSLLFNISFNQKKTSLYSSIDPIHDEQSLRMGYRSPYAQRGFNINAEMHRAKDIISGDFSADYFHPYFTAGIKHKSNFTGNKSQTDSMTFGTALAFAQKKFALTRPFSGSFALVSLSGTKWNRTINLNPTGDNDSVSQVGVFNGVLTSIGDYRRNRVWLNKKELKAGEVFDNEISVVVPSYKSGHLVQMKLLSEVFASGHIFLDGAPYQYKYAQLNDKNGKMLAEIFTDDQGSFNVDGVPKGDYVLLFDDSFLPANISLKNDIDGFIDLGQINMEYKKVIFNGSN